MSATSRPDRRQQAPARADGMALRASDAEREVVLGQLREHTIAGRLSAEELGERSAAVLTARTRGELDAAVVDLPSAEGSATVASPTLPAGWRRRGRSWSIGVMSRSSIRGHWRPQGTIWAVAVMGSCTVDLREALVDRAEVTIRALALMGSVEVLLPAGVDADLAGIPFLGVKRLRLAPGPPSSRWRARVQALPWIGTVSVRSKRPPASQRRA